MTKEELRQYRGLAVEVKQLEGRLKELEGALFAPSGQRFSRTPSGPSDAGRTMEAAVDKHDQLLQLYARKLLEQQNRLLAIEAAVDQLEDPAQRAVVRYRYIEGFDWPRISREMRYSQRQVQRIHGYALLKMQPAVPFWDDKDCSGALDE